MNLPIASRAPAQVFSCIVAVFAFANSSGAQNTPARDMHNSFTTATWNVTRYRRGIEGRETRQPINSAGNKQWCFKAPGLYREEILGNDGQIRTVRIHSAVELKTLELDLKRKKGSLRHFYTSRLSPSGPFRNVLLSILNRDDLTSLGVQTIKGRDAVGVRYSFPLEFYPDQQWSYDIWTDAKTNELVAYRNPGLDVLDPTKTYPKAFYVYPGAMTGNLFHDIAFDVELEDSLFSFEPPEGFDIETRLRPEVSESDVIDFLRVVAAYHDGKFPNNVLGRSSSAAEHERFERIERQKYEEERTKAENVMVEAMHKWWHLGIPGPGPLHVFVHGPYHIEKGSWAYVGKGVRLGDQTAPVCWYRPKNAKQYRVVYGDLSIKNVPASELPATNE